MLFYPIRNPEIQRRFWKPPVREGIAAGRGEASENTKKRSIW